MVRMATIVGNCAHLFLAIAFRELERISVSFFLVFYLVKGSLLGVVSRFVAHFDATSSVSPIALLENTTLFSGEINLGGELPILTFRTSLWDRFILFYSVFKLII